MKLEKWTPNFEKNQNFSMALVASRRSGKTTLLKYIVNNYLKDLFDEVILITSSLNNNIYIDFDAIKICEFDNDIINSIISLQQEDSSKKILIILDDAVGNKIKFSSGILKLFCISRNLNISIIYSVQSATLLLPDHKENLDYLIIMKVKTLPKIKHIIDTFLMGNLESETIKTNKEEFNFWHNLIKNKCQNYKSIIVNYLDDKILEYKIPE